MNNLSRDFLYYMENKLATLIENYTDESELLRAKLYLALLSVEDFYYSDYWTSRFKRTTLEEIDVSIIQGTISELIKETYFRMIDEDENINGSSIRERISININMRESKVNDSHIHNLVMHEFGHIMYSHIPILKELNSPIIGNPNIFLTQPLKGEDAKYFTDADEIRQRILPVVREMYDNGWTLEETYFNSPNLIQDPIYKMYSKEYIIKLLANLI